MYDIYPIYDIHVMFAISCYVFELRIYDCASLFRPFNHTCYHTSMQLKIFDLRLALKYKYETETDSSKSMQLILKSEFKPSTSR